MTELQLDIYQAFGLSQQIIKALLVLLHETELEMNPEWLEALNQTYDLEVGTSAENIVLKIRSKENGN